MMGGAALLLAIELVYVLVANALLFSGVITRAASMRPDNTDLQWDRAYSPWPGRAYVDGFRLRVQDPVQEFRLTVSHAKVDVVLWELLRRRFRASRVEAEGVSFRMLLKLDQVAGHERRLAAFPPLDGFASPALRAHPGPPPATEEDIKGLWRVQLDAVDATVNELWFLEYRYQGPARVHGGFALEPLRKLWVGPAQVELEGGKLTAGSHLLSSRFGLQAEVTIAPTELASSPGLLVLRTLTCAVHFDLALESLSVATLYVDGLSSRGTARLTANVRVANGLLTSESAVEAWLAGVDVGLDGYRFIGDAHGRFKASVQSTEPMVSADLAGTLAVPWFQRDPAVAALTGVKATVAFANADLSHGLTVQWIRASIGEARVREAQAITRRVGKLIPVVAPLVLGDGPLVASATLHRTPRHTVVRLTHLTLGAAELEGAAVAGVNGWTGAAAGHFGAVPLAFLLHNDSLQAVPFQASPWLPNELAKAGIGVE